jgi:S1-C subfamily serine protease
MRLSFVVVPAVGLLAASAIAHATAGPSRLGAIVVSVESRGLRAATGFVAADGRVVTVAHAVGDGPVVVRGPGGTVRRASVVRRDDELDLALLSVPGLEHAGASALGGPRLVVRRDGATTTVPADVLRRIDARVRDAATDVVLERPALELSAAIGAGDSGAPVIGADAQVAGVIFARSRDREGIAYAVDAAALEAFLR